MEWLHYDCGVPFNRMSTEMPIKRKAVGDQFRADILAYDASMKPFILVECKSEDVKLNEAAAMQAARYNEQIKAPYIVLSNGLGELGFRIKGDGIEALDPSSLHAEDQKPNDFIRDTAYWIKRGFLGQQSEKRDALSAILNRLYSGESAKSTYIRAPKMDGYPPANHYYITLKNWSAGVLAHGDGTTWLCGLHASPESGNLMLLICLDGSPGPKSPDVVFSKSGAEKLPSSAADTVTEQLLSPGFDSEKMSVLLSQICSGKTP